MKTDIKPAKAAKKAAAPAKTEGIATPGRGRPRKGAESGPTVPRSVRFPESVWKQIEKKAKNDGLTVHAALRVAIVKWVEG
jgi:hypothetical protein